MEEDPIIGWGSGVKKVVVGGWGQDMGARGVVHGVEDKEVSDLPGNACAWIFVLGLYHARAPILIAEFYLVDRGLRHRLPGFSSMGRLVILP